MFQTVDRVTSPMFSLKNKIDRDVMCVPVDDDACDISGSQADVIQHCTKDLFCFTETQGGPLHIRDCGIPELVPFRISLDPEPTWLDEPRWNFEGEMTEEKDGFSLSFPNGLYVFTYRFIPCTLHGLTSFQSILYTVSATSHWCCHAICCRCLTYETSFSPVVYSNAGDVNQHSPWILSSLSPVYFNSQHHRIAILSLSQFFCCILFFLLLNVCNFQSI